MLEKEEPFKLNEFRYEIVCLACDNKYDFSKDNLVNCNIPMKQKLLDLIEEYMKKNKTLNIEMNKTRILMLNY